jgi:hypothetical protein
MHQGPSCAYAYELFFLFLEVEAVFFCSWKLKVFIFDLREVQGFAFAFECCRFLLFLLNVESSCSYFWMLKVITFTF